MSTSRSLLPLPSLWCRGSLWLGALALVGSVAGCGTDSDTNGGDPSAAVASAGAGGSAGAEGMQGGGGGGASAGGMQGGAGGTNQGGQAAAGQGPVGQGGAAGASGGHAAGGGGAAGDQTPMGGASGDTSMTGGEGGTGNAGAGGQPQIGGSGGEDTSGAGMGGASGDTSMSGAGGTGAAEGGMAGEPSDPMDEYTPCPVDGSPCKLLPLGDSITEGFGSSGGGYRVELFRQALSGGKNITFVGNANPNGPQMVDGTPFPRAHEGHGGFTISGNNGIAGSITNDALSQHQPHIVLLMIGTNDLNGNIDVGNAPQRLSSLIDDILAGAPERLLAVASIIPIENASNGPKVAPYNEAIKDMVAGRAAEGQHVIFVDNHAAFTSNASYATQWMGDTLHPNDTGYAVLGQSFYESVAEYLRGD